MKQRQSRLFSNLEARCTSGTRSSRSLWFATPLLTAVAASMLAACATISTRTVKTEDKLVRESTEEALIDGPGKPTATLDGTRLELRATGLCQIRSIRHMDHVETKERHMEGAYPWYVGGAGVAALAAGTVGMVDATQVYADDPNSRTYNPTGPDKAYLANGALLATGVAAGTLLLVNAIRASGTEDVVTPKEVRSDPTGDPFPCAHAVREHAPVAAIVGDEQVPLGTTNRAGTLEVDLDATLPETFTGNELELALLGTAVMTLDVSAVHHIREERAWSGLDVDQCRKPTSSRSCDDMTSFLSRYPEGTHHREASELLEAAQPALSRSVDDEQWHSIQSSCGKTTLDSVEAINRACEPYRQYVERFPAGLHVTEAKAMLAASTRAIGVVEAAERKRALQAEAEEKVAAAAEHKKCQAGCRMACAGPRMHDKEMCQRGCYALQCGDGDQCLGECDMACAQIHFARDHAACVRDCRITKECGRHE